MKYFKIYRVIVLGFFLVNLAPGQFVWNTIGQMPVMVSRGEAVVLDTSIYIIGGYSDSLNGLAAILQFRPPDAWHFAGSLDHPRMDFVAGVDSGRIYCVGGTLNGMGVTQVPDERLEEIDTGGGVLQSRSRFDSSFMRIDPTGQIHNGILYLFGGLSRRLIPFVLEYDLRLKTAQGYYNIPQVSGQMSAIIGDDVYLFGGASIGVGRSIQRYNMLTHTLEMLPLNLRFPRAFGRAIRLGSSDSIMILGGTDESRRALNTVEIFTATAGHQYVMASAAPIRFARSRFMAVQYRNAVYILGGEDNNNGPVPAIEQYVFGPEGVSEGPGNRPQNFALDQNYPNPFNPSTKIAFSVKNSAYLSIDIYTLLGAHLVTLAEGAYAPGSYSVTWNGCNNSGAPLPSGVYLYRLSSAGSSFSRKLLLIR